MIIYEAKKGDTLYNIARRYGITLSELERFNGFFDPSRLAVGQDVLIPVPYSLYKVKSGDSLYSIALQYGISADDLIRANPDIRPPYLIYPDDEIRIPNTENKPTISVNGYAYPNINDNVLRQTLPFLTYLSIFSYSVNSDGTLNGIDDERLISTAKEYRTKPVMVITNTEEGGGFRSEITDAVLNSQSIRQTLIDNVVSTALSKGYGGVDVDFEYIYPKDRNAYNEFLELLRDRLHAENLTLSTAIAPKLSATQIGTLYEAHDYKAHGSIVDYLIIMTYEWGYLYGPPLAVAPETEVRKVISYAVTEIPSAKILMGMPNYGYDWTLPYKSGTPARILSINNAVNLANEVGADIQFSNTSKAPFFEYTKNGTNHIVWFENARSTAARLQIVKDYNLGGVSYWTINQFFAQNWRVLESMFNIRKF